MAVLLRTFFIGLVVALGGVAAHAQETRRQVADDQRLSPTDIQRLVVGDGYTIVAQRNGIRERLMGDLVKANDRWIVLRSVSEGRHEYGVPVLSSVPFVGKRMFRSVGIGRTDELLWIPREAAQITGRTLAADKPAIDTPQGEDPAPQSDCTVQLVTEQRTAQREGKVVATSDGELTLAIKTVAAVHKPRAVLSRIPVVGSSFYSTTYETRRTKERLALETVLCVRMSNSTGVVAVDERSKDASTAK